jgi:hypothetical protein
VLDINQGNIQSTGPPAAKDIPRMCLAVLTTILKELPLGRRISYFCFNPLIWNLVALRRCLSIEARLESKAMLDIKTLYQAINSFKILLLN